MLCSFLIHPRLVEEPKIIFWSRGDWIISQNRNVFKKEIGEGAENEAEGQWGVHWIKMLASEPDNRSLFWDPQGSRSELTPVCCSLTSTHMPLACDPKEGRMWVCKYMQLLKLEENGGYTQKLSFSGCFVKSCFVSH